MYEKCIKMCYGFLLYVIAADDGDHKKPSQNYPWYHLSRTGKNRIYLFTSRQAVGCHPHEPWQVLCQNGTFGTENPTRMALNFAKDLALDTWGATFDSLLLLALRIQVLSFNINGYCNLFWTLCHPNLVHSRSGKDSFYQPCPGEAAWPKPGEADRSRLKLWIC